MKFVKEYVKNMAACWRIQWKILKFGVSKGPKLQRTCCAVMGTIVIPLAAVYNLVIPAVAVFKKLPVSLAEKEIDDMLDQERRPVFA